jgi:hypothetical protein
MNNLPDQQKRTVKVGDIINVYHHTEIYNEWRNKRARVIALHIKEDSNKIINLFSSWVRLGWIDKPDNYRDKAPTEWALVFISKIYSNDEDLKCRKK